MIKQVTAKNYDAFIKEKRVAAIHFDAQWDVTGRQAMRTKMQEAEHKLGEQINFGEVDCDHDPELARSLYLLTVPSVAYYLDGNLSALVTGTQQDLRDHVSSLLRGNRSSSPKTFRFRARR